jgi:pyridoxine kinase
MARVLAISSQTVFGPVGNSAAVPALQAEGHEVLQLPTVLLSHHPGHGKPAGQGFAAPLHAEIFETLYRVHAFQNLAAVMTGYFSTAAQVSQVAQHVARLKREHRGLVVLIDPVIGDHGALYVEPTVAATIRDELLPLANITTPNLFELQWLTGETDVAKAVAALAIAETLVTSVPIGEQEIATQLHYQGAVIQHRTPKMLQVPHGTGDYFAGCYLAQRLKASPEMAFAAACARLQKAIQASLGKTALQLT